MTITINSNCSEITFTSDVLLVTNTSSVVTITNGDTSHTLNFAGGVSSITIEPSDIDQQTSFSDGVYSVKLLTTLASTAIKEDLGCAVVLCGLKCSEKMLNWYTNKDIEKVIQYEALSIGKNCNSCSCATLDEIYKNLTENDTIQCGTCSCKL